jgi:anaerobic selenocysteine-containing dehydrogenase
LVTFGHYPSLQRPPVAFWVAVATSLDDSTREADVVLPLALFSEAAGTRSDLFGRVHHLTAALPPAGECRAARDVAEALAAAWQAAPSGEALSRPAIAARTVHTPKAGVKLLLVREYSPFSHLGAALTTRVPGFEPLAGEGEARLHPEDARRLGVGAGDGVSLEGEGGAFIAVAQLSAAVPPGTMRLVVRATDEIAPGGVPLEALFGPNPSPAVVRAVSGASGAPAPRAEAVHV